MYIDWDQRTTGNSNRIEYLGHTVCGEIEGIKESSKGYIEQQNVYLYPEITATIYCTVLSINEQVLTNAES